MGSSQNEGPCLRSLFKCLPYSFGDLKKDPNLENHPYGIIRIMYNRSPEGGSPIASILKGNV